MAKKKSAKSTEPSKLSDGNIEKYKGVIFATPDENGRYSITLYGERTEIDETMFENGEAEIKALGDTYLVCKASAEEAREKEKAGEAVDTPVPFQTEEDTKEE